MIVDLKQNDEKGEPSWLHEPLPSDAITTPGNKTTVSTSPSSSTSKSWEEEKKNAFEDISRDSSQTKKSRVSAGTTGSRPVVIDIQPQPLDDEICNCCGCHLDLVLMGFQVFHFLGGLTALASISANFYVFTDMTLQDDIREVILRIYALLFAFITILVETDMDVFMQYFTLFQSWFLRGLWYAFVGILTSNNLLQYFPPFLLM